jgi:hypothetical protein
MKANIKKPPKPPKSWDRLPAFEKKVIEDYCSQVVTERVNHEEAELQKRWLQLACIVLHSQKDPYGKMRCMAFLKDWKRAYNVLARYKTDDGATAYLKKEMDSIFGVDGYPYEWIDKLEK